MKMSIQTQQALKLQQLLSQIELPEGEVLMGGFNIDGEFYAQVEGKSLCVVVNIIDDVACQLSIVNCEEDEEVGLYAIHHGATEDDLKDYVRVAVKNIRI